MGSQRIKQPKKQPEKKDSPRPPEEKLKKKRRWKSGGYRTRQRVRKAQDLDQVLPRAVLKRLIHKTMSDEGLMMRWTPNALAALAQIIDAKAHRVLALSTTLANCAGKATLNSTHVKIAKIINAEYGH